MGRRARTGDEPLLRVTEPEAQQPPAQRVPDAITGRIASILEFYQFATKLDVALLLLAVVISCSAGAAMPLMQWAFSRTIGSLGSINLNSTGIDNSNILLFVYIGCGSWVAQFCYRSLSDISKSRQLTRYRKEYIKAIVRQDPGWFDLNSPQELSTRIGEAMTLIDGGLGSNALQLFELLGGGSAAVALAFSFEWRVTLICLAVSPLLAFSFALFTRARPLRPRTLTQSPTPAPTRTLRLGACSPARPRASRTRTAARAASRPRRSRRSAPSPPWAPSSLSSSGTRPTSPPPSASASGRRCASALRAGCCSARGAS